MHIRKNDTVMVIAGKEKGKSGKVLKVFPDRQRAVVEKLNIVKRHQRPTQKLRQGGIIEKEAPIHVSNLMVLDPKNHKPTRVGYQLAKDGKKLRVARRSGAALEA